MDLKRKLADHIHEVNSNLSCKNSNFDENHLSESVNSKKFKAYIGFKAIVTTTNELNYGLANEEEEHEKERIKREKYREELALEIEQRRLANIYRNEVEKQLENAANMNDAQRLGFLFF